MKNEAKETVSNFLNAVKNGDNATLAQLLHPEIKWNQPGNNLVSGNKESNMEVFGMVGKMFEISGNTLRLAEIKSMAVNDKKVSCLLRWTAIKPDGTSMDVDNIDVYNVSEGQITEAVIFSADLEKEDAFWR